MKISKRKECAFNRKHKEEMMRLQTTTITLLETLERTIDPQTEEDFRTQWRDFLFDRFDGLVFTPSRKKCSNPDYAYQNIMINDALQDYEKMLVSQLERALKALASPSADPCIRANYGTGIMTSLFGAKVFLMPYETNTLPTTYSLNDTEQIREILEKGMPSLDTGYGRQVMEFGEFCAELFEHYPNIQKYVSVYHPDAQGPLDICELLWGSEFFYAIYDEPELVHGLLELITDTYIAFMDKWFQIFPSRSDMNSHWGCFMHRGSILLRNDSAMNLSAEFYREFAMPYDAKLLEHYNGGAVHFCGRGDHYMDVLCSIPKMYGINIGQPHLNDMEKIFTCTVDKGIKILDLLPEFVDQFKNRPGQFHHNVSIS